MELVGQKIERDTSKNDTSVWVKVNPITKKIKFSSSVYRTLDLAGKYVGFGYEPSADRPTGAALYVAKDNKGCKVSSTGDTQSKYHCERLAMAFNGGDMTSTFVLNLDEVGEELSEDFFIHRLTPTIDEETAEEMVDTAAPEAAQPVVVDTTTFGDSSD